LVLVPFKVFRSGRYPIFFAEYFFSRPNYIWPLRRNS
jgi:hypothetical protein